MDAETKQAFEQLNQRFDQIEKRFEQTDERIFDVETNLLKAFEKWAATSDARTRVLPSIQERMTLMEDRITAVEHKLLGRGQ